MVTGEPSGESTLAGDRIVAHPSAFGIVRMIGVEIRGCVECGLAPAGAEQQTDRKARKQSGYGQHEGNHVTPGGLAKPNWPIGIFFLPSDDHCCPSVQGILRHDGMDAVKAVRIVLHYGIKTRVSDWSRPVRSRIQGGAVVGMIWETGAQS